VIGAQASGWLSILIGGGLLGTAWKASGVVRDFRDGQRALQDALRVVATVLASHLAEHEKQPSNLDGGQH